MPNITLHSQIQEAARRISYSCTWNDGSDVFPQEVERILTESLEPVRQCAGAIVGMCNLALSNNQLDTWEADIFTAIKQRAEALLKGDE